LLYSQKGNHCTAVNPSATKAVSSNRILIGKKNSQTGFPLDFKGIKVPLAAGQDFKNTVKETIIQV
jgi:hypothetical protein